VDEAQNLSLRCFEELRMLSNLDSENEPLVQIILVGQPQLRRRLAEPSLAQLTQRISVHYHLSPMQADDIGKYIQHRLVVAGLHHGASVFEIEAVDTIAEISKGVPRIINSICDASLAYAFADGLKTVSRKVVENVIYDNELIQVGNAGVKIDSIGDSNDNGDQSGSDLRPELNANFVQSGASGFGGVISHLMERIGYLEARVSEAQSTETERSIVLLQEMLAKEREKNFQLAGQLSELKYEHKKLMKDLQELEGIKQERPSEMGPISKTRLPWRVFARDKK
jgi:general secretion pathway protein A